MQIGAVKIHNFKIDVLFQMHFAQLAEVLQCVLG